LTDVVIKTDFRVEREDLYSASAEDFVEVEVPILPYLMVDGEGDPSGSADCRDAARALRVVSLTAESIGRRQLEREHVIGPLEGLWYAGCPGPFADAPRREWLWTMMIRQPDWIGPEEVDAAKAVLAGRRLPALDSVRYAKLFEGRSVQIMRIGPREGSATIDRMHREALPARGVVENGRYHEIYLSDPRRVAPERMETVVRQPVRPLVRSRPARPRASRLLPSVC
jgi:hypothetical protein